MECDYASSQQESRQDASSAGDPRKELAFCCGSESLMEFVKRNIKRFLEDFCFPLTSQEYEVLKCQIGIPLHSQSEPDGSCLAADAARLLITGEVTASQVIHRLPPAFAKPAS